MTTPLTKVYVTTNVIKGVSGSGGSPQFVKCFTNSNSAVRYYRKVLLLSVELRIVDFAVESAKLHKGVMVTGLYDVAVLHNKYQVGVLDCRKPVRVSTLLVASSRISIGAFSVIALAIATSYF